MIFQKEKNNIMWSGKTLVYTENKTIAQNLVFLSFNFSDKGRYLK